MVEQEKLLSVTEKQPNPQTSWAIIRFPGTWSELDTEYALQDQMGQKSDILWHSRIPTLDSYDAINLPGGFSYGDHLRTGALAAISPAMTEVKNQAEEGKLVLGVCNGFQILCEAKMLPGILRKNEVGQFRCEDTYLRVERNDTAFTSRLETGQVIKVPISHGEGNFWCDEATLSNIEENGLVLFRYCTPDGKVIREVNPNGSLNNIAGMMNEEGNVLGMMPHPERVVNELLGGTDGKLIFGSMIDAIRK